MTETSFPLLSGSAWLATKEALHAYSKVLGAYRAALAPRQKHWWHISLLPCITGMRTQTLRTDDTYFELTLNLAQSRVEVRTQDAEHNISLHGQSAAVLREEVDDFLSKQAIMVSIDDGKVSSEHHREYAETEARHFSAALQRIAHNLNIVKGEQRKETSPVQIWPHHCDLSLVWFSGRLVADVDPNDEESADEQMNFGFSPGDEVLPEPYFYITAYPSAPELSEALLPTGASWQAEPWPGVVLPYPHLTTIADPDDYLLALWRGVLETGKALMAPQA